MTWAQLRAAFATYLAARGYAQSTCESSERWLARFAQSCRHQGVTSPTGIAPQHLAAFRRELEWKANGYGGLLSASTQAQALRMVRQWLRWATRQGHLLLDPSRDLVVRATPSSCGRILSREEVERLLQAPPAHTPQGLRDRAVLEAFYSSGLRRGECRSLDVADVDLAQALLVVRRGKGGKDRVLPMMARLVQALERYLEKGRLRLLRQPEESALFVDRRGGRLSLQRVSQLVKTHARNAGLGLVHPHRLRHAFAIHLLEGGAELVAIQALLGHAQLDTTEVYTRVSMLELGREHRRTHPRA